MWRRPPEELRFSIRYSFLGTPCCGTPLALSDPIFFVADLLGGTLIIGLAFSLVVGTVIGIESAAVALLLAPLSLLGRRLILRRRSVVESAGDSSQSQP